VLGVHRTEEDVPGWVIPSLYREYLTSHDPHPLERVLYHNRLDILSMVTLAAELMALYNLPAEDFQDAEDALAMARAMQRRGARERAESLYRVALRANPLSEGALSDLARMLKQTGRGEEAALLWETWAGANRNAWEPRIELAKHFEWRVRDLAIAMRWAEEAVLCLPSGRSEQDRLDRLARKRARISNPKKNRGGI
jgi:uncharacterized protein